MQRTFALIAVGKVLALAGLACLAADQLGRVEAATGASSVRTHTVQALPQGKVDLNRAGVEDLARLPGINSALAERIVKHRPYRKLDDVVSRRVLGKKQFARIREFVTIGPLSP